MGRFVVEHRLPEGDATRLTTVNADYVVPAAGDYLFYVDGVEAEETRLVCIVPRDVVHAVHRKPEPDHSRR